MPDAIAWFDLGEDTEIHEKMVAENGVDYQVNKYFEELAEAVTAWLQYQNKPSAATLDALMVEISHVENVAPYPRMKWGNEVIERHKAAARDKMERELERGEEWNIHRGRGR